MPAPNPADLAIQWQPLIATLNKLNLSPAQKDRVDAVINVYRAILEDLSQAVDEARRNPYLNREGVAHAVQTAQGKVRQSMERIAGRLEAFRDDAQQTVTLPDEVANIPHVRVEEIREAIAERDPLELRAMFQSAAVTGDLELIAAMIGANKNAYPGIAAAIDDGTLHDAALNLKFKDPDARRMATDEATANELLTAINGDLLNATGGAGDPIAQQAAAVAA